MPDAAQAIPFWTSVANTFKGNDAVIFDLFNEPYASRATGNTTTGWQCWENGGTCSGISYQVAGMQQMVNAVRSTGANNVLMLGGEEYSNDLTSWLQYEPTDPDHNLVASWHSYNFNTCSSQSCWTSQVAPVDRVRPGGRRRDRRERLRRKLHHPADDMDGVAEHQLPRLGLERRLRLLKRPRPDHRLHRDADQLRRRVQGRLAGLACWLRPTTRLCRLSPSALPRLPGQAVTAWPGFPLHDRGSKRGNGSKSTHQAP